VHWLDARRGQARDNYRDEYDTEHKRSETDVTLQCQRSTGRRQDEWLSDTTRTCESYRKQCQPDGEGWKDVSQILLEQEWVIGGTCRARGCEQICNTGYECRGAENAHHAITNRDRCDGARDRKAKQEPP
jgi:hypothetical protein